MCQSNKEVLEKSRGFSGILKGWAEAFKEEDSAVGQFNLLNAASGNLNENAHTRILAALLKIKSVRSCFFNYLARKYPHRGLERVANSDAIYRASVRCFENYIDACIWIGDYCVVMENKVKGACDQPEQIDRYVKSIIAQGIDSKNIFVLYITQNGGRPSENSYKEAKSLLECGDGENTGRFFAISYLHDILPWLYETMGRKIGFELCEPEREMLNSGLVQYTNYIEGPDLLGLRDVKDGYTSFRKKKSYGRYQRNVSRFGDGFMYICGIYSTSWTAANLSNFEC